MTSFYDVVVIGDELAGAAAAGHLARRGLRVLVVCSAPVERDALGPYLVPRAPLTLTGLEAPALKRLVADLNLLQLLRKRVEPNQPAYQVLLPDARLDVSVTDLPRELSRELPSQAAAYDRFSARAATTSATLESQVVEDVTLPPDGFWDRRDLKRMAARLPPDGEDAGLPPEARMIAALPLRFAVDLDEPGAIALDRISDLYRRGTWSLDGGREALRALLLERVRTYSGEVRYDTARGLVTRRRRVTGVAIGVREEEVGCSQVICAMPAAELLRLLPEAPPRRLADAASLEATWHRYLLHVVAPPEALPDALGRLAFSVRDPAAPLEGANLIALHVSSTQGRQQAVITVEALARDPSIAALHTLRAGVRAHLETLIPFLDRHLLAAWSPHDGLPPERLPASAAADLPAPSPMAAVWSLPAPRALGVCGIPHATGLKHVLFANRQVLPGLGFEGELVCGWGAARLACARDKRRAIDKTDLLGAP